MTDISRYKNSIIYSGLSAPIGTDNFFNIKKYPIKISYGTPVAVSDESGGYKSSAYLNSSILSVSSSSLAFGNGDFSIAFKYKPNVQNCSSWGSIIQIGIDATNGLFGIGRNSASSPITLYQDYYYNGWNGTGISGQLDPNKLNEITMSRINGTLRVGVNGALGLERGAVANAGNLTGNIIRIGGRSSNNLFMAGNLQDIIVTHDVLFADNFTFPEKLVTPEIWGLWCAYQDSVPTLRSVSGSAVTSEGGAVASVSVIEASNKIRICKELPESNSWNATIPDGTHYFLFEADGYVEQMSGPHTVSESGVSPAIPDIVLGSSSGTMKTVGYAF